MSASGLLALGVGLAGCGQRGPLYLPTDPAAANRATLPQTLIPGLGRGEAKPSGNEAAPGAKPAPAASPASSSPSDNPSSGNAPSGAAR